MIPRWPAPRRSADAAPAKGLRQFLTAEEQQAWLDDEPLPPDAEERDQSLELRFKYAARFEKLLRRPQADDVLNILGRYGDTCLPLPRRTERWYWSVSCLPSTDRTLARVNASWMELFALQPDNASALVGEAGGRPGAPAADEYLAAPPANSPQTGEGLKARFILHLADFTADGSPDPDQLDTDLIEACAGRPEDVTHSFWRDNRGILIVKVRGVGAIRHFMEHPHALRAIRNFNLTHMNRGRNAYQASHCYSLADAMTGD